MEIKTKYDLNDSVYAINEKFKVQKYRIVDVFAGCKLLGGNRGEINVTYILRPFEDDLQEQVRKESEIFKTKEELLKYVNTL